MEFSLFLFDFFFLLLRLDATTALDFVWTCFHSPRLWQGRDQKSTAVGSQGSNSVSFTWFKSHLIDLLPAFPFIVCCLFYSLRGSRPKRRERGKNEHAKRVMVASLLEACLILLHSFWFILTLSLNFYGLPRRLSILKLGFFSLSLSRRRFMKNQSFIWVLSRSPLWPVSFCRSFLLVSRTGAKEEVSCGFQHFTTKIAGEFVSIFFFCIPN